MNLATGMGLITEDNDVLTIPKLYAAGCIHTIQNGGDTLVCAPFRMSPDGTFITLSVSNSKDKIFPIKLPSKLLIAIKIFYFKDIGHAGHETHLVTGHRFFSLNIKF